MATVPLPSERALRGEQLRSVPTGDDAEAILRGSKSRSEYDPTKLYGGAYNNHDHTTKIRLNVHPDVARGLTTAITTGALSGYGIHSVNHLFRAALVDLLHKLAAMTGDGEIAGLASRELVRAQLDQIVEGSKSDAATVEMFTESAQMFHARGEWQRLSDSLDLAEIMVESLTEPHRSKMQEQIDYYATRLPQ